MALPLRGIRVLDLTRLLPGPLASLYFADLGAEVIKIEAPEGGDYARWFPPLRTHMSGIFAALNRNKSSLCLDLKHPQGVAVFLRLVAKADVVLEGFRPGVMRRLGLDYELLREENPALVYCAITGYGQDGAMAHKAGHDLNYLAMTGLLDRQAAAGQEPVMPGVQIGDVAGGSLHAVISVLAALLRRQQTGEGAFCDVSMCEGILPFLSMELGSLAAGLTPPTHGEGMLSGGHPCYGVYRCCDGLSLSVGSLEPKFWSRFVEALGLPELAFSGLETGAEGEAVRTQIQAVLATKPRAHWVELFVSKDACVEPVLTLDELPGHPLFASRGSFVTHEHPTEGEFCLPRTPLRLSEMEPPPHQGAPQLGEQTEMLLSQMGWSAEEIAALAADGVFGASS